MNTQSVLSEETTAWLLEAESPGARYLAMRDLLRLPPNDAALADARALAHAQGPIATVLQHMEEAGYWSEPGPGYLPKYWSTVWSILALAQLGALVEEDARVAKACAYVLDHALAPQGQFTASGTAAGTADCLQGNLCWALTALGCEDPRLETAYAWMARSVTGEGLAPASDRHAEMRFNAGKCGPLFACGSNNKRSCAWGGVKVMLAFSRWPKQRWTPLIARAVEQGAEFLLEGDPAKAGYPNGWAEKPSSNWWKFGFPVFYVTDMLQNVEALVGLGYGKDPRLEEALSIIRQKCDSRGRWALEYDYEGKTWVSFGPKKQPNKWVTLRARKVLLDPQIV